LEFSDSLLRFTVTDFKLLFKRLFFTAKRFDGSDHLDLVMIRPPGIDHGTFAVSPTTVWYARVLLLFAASATTDTGYKSFECALVSTLKKLETYEDPENGYYVLCNYDVHTQNILGKHPVVPVGDTVWCALTLDQFCTTCATPFQAHPATAGQVRGGCRVWFVNSWALRWSSDL
jgi:hypothetical protein